MTQQEMLRLLKPFVEYYNAQLRSAVVDRPKEIEIVSLDLATAQSRNAPLRVDFPFKSFRVRSGSDSNAYCYFLPYGKEGDSQALGALMKVNSTFKSDSPLTGATFYWPAQTGKSLVIELYRDSEVTPGNFTTEIAEVYSSITNNTAVSVGTTATLVASQDLDRKVLTLYNDDATKTVYVGGSGVTTANGIPLLAGSYMELKNTAAIYAIVSSGTASVRVAYES